MMENYDIILSSDGKCKMHSWEATVNCYNLDGSAIQAHAAEASPKEAIKDLKKTVKEMILKLQNIDYSKCFKTYYDESDGKVKHKKTTVDEEHNEFVDYVKHESAFHPYYYTFSYLWEDKADTANVGEK